MRLNNMGRFGGFLYRVVLDSNKVSTNYIERTKGANFDVEQANHSCESCMRPIEWMNWKFEDTFAESDCPCGRRATIKILPFIFTATEVIVDD